MKTRFYTITIGEKRYDLPKDMPVPQKGDYVLIDGIIGVVDHVNYHIVGYKLYMVNIFTKKE
jgi:hypothetical protein